MSKLFYFSMAPLEQCFFPVFLLWFNKSLKLRSSKLELNSGYLFWHRSHLQPYNTNFHSKSRNWVNVRQFWFQSNTKKYFVSIMNIFYASDIVIIYKVKSSWARHHLIIVASEATSTRKIAITNQKKQSVTMKVAHKPLISITLEQLLINFITSW